MLSKKTQYAFKALTFMAEKKKDGPVLIAEIASKKKIPLKFFRKYFAGTEKGRYTG